MEGNGSQPQHKAQWLTRLHIVIEKEQLPELEAWSERNGMAILQKNETLEIFLKQGETTFRDLEAARAGNDTEGMRAAAHSLKSASQNIWATRLGDLLNRLETTAADGDLAGAIEIFEQVRPEYAAVISYLEERDR